MKSIVSLFVVLGLLLGLIIVPVTAKEQVVPTGKYGEDYTLYGDVNMDQSIDAKDALLVLRCAVEKIVFTPLQQNLGNLNDDSYINAKDALLILQYAVQKIQEFSVGKYFVDRLGEQTPTLPDGIPDKYQKQLVFQVKNGSWSNGSAEDIVCYVTLMRDGKWDEDGQAVIIPPQGMLPSEGYYGGAWEETPPSVVTGTDSQTFVFSFSEIEEVPATPVEPSNQVGYLTNHYLLQENGLYPIEPTEREFSVGAVGEQVTATPREWEGYCLNPQISNLKGTLIPPTMQGDLVILNLYYDRDENNDRIPDRYQKPVRFVVENGTWEDGSTSPIEILVTLTRDEVWDEQGSGLLEVPTGMKPVDDYQGGKWVQQPPERVTGNHAETFVYQFEPPSTVAEVGYTVCHYLGKEDGSYEESPVLEQNLMAPVGSVVTATPQVYEGYTLNWEISVLSGQVTEYDALVLQLYYDKDLVGGETQEPEIPPLAENYITKYDKSNSVNGAYEKDTTADTSFVINNQGLAPNTMYLLTKAVFSNVDHARLIYSLQGLLNRDFGMDAQHSTLLYSNGGEIDNGWLTEITKNGSILQKANQTEGLMPLQLSDFDSFYMIFREVIASCGIILWDGNVPATANVAATICGLDGYLPVLDQSPLHKKLVADGVPVKQSLVGMFKDGNKGQTIVGTSVKSTGSAKNDAYLWALEKYFPRCTTRYLAYTLDGAPTLKGYDAYENHPTALLDTASINCLANHDYLIARRCFFFDLAPYKGEAACDDPAQKNGLADYGTDNATMLKIYQARYDRANGEFGALMGFPPWWLKYTAFREQGSKAETWVEWLFCEYITCYNLAKEADAQAPASMSNGSVYYKYVPKQSSYTNNKTVQSLTFDKNTYYYTIYLGDYDSSAWLKEHMYNMWIKNGGDTKRGTLPLMWGINPNLSYRVPMIFDYLYENKSANDYFVGGDGGAGYVIPAGLFHDVTLSYMGEKRPSGNAAAGDIFAKYTKPFYERFDLDITGFLINGANGNISKNIATCVNQYSPIGSFANAASMGIYKYNGAYYVNCYTGIGTSGAASTMYSFANGGMSSYFSKKNFGAYRTVCHTPTQVANNVAEFSEYANGKGMKVQYCDPYTYFKLLKESGQGSTIR